METVTAVIGLCAGKEESNLVQADLELHFAMKEMPSLQEKHCSEFRKV
jgi:hypothetical protein